VEAVPFVWSPSHPPLPHIPCTPPLDVDPTPAAAPNSAKKKARGQPAGGKAPGAAAAANTGAAEAAATWSERFPNVRFCHGFVAGTCRNTASGAACKFPHLTLGEVEAAAAAGAAAGPGAGERRGKSGGRGGGKGNGGGGKGNGNKRGRSGRAAGKSGHYGPSEPRPEAAAAGGEALPPQHVQMQRDQRGQRQRAQDNRQPQIQQGQQQGQQQQQQQQQGEKHGQSREQQGQATQQETPPAGAPRAGKRARGPRGRAEPRDWDGEILKSDGGKPPSTGAAAVWDGEIQS
jgi:transcription termination factor Rho